MRLVYTSMMLLVSSLLAGCGGVTEYRADSSGHLRPVAHYHDLWEHIWEDSIAAEVRGDPPPPRCKTCPRSKTWKGYWQKEYAELEIIGQRSGSNSWAPKQIARARALRIKHGLDPY
jgi:hypothetical protein